MVSGSVVKSLNSLKDNITLAAGSNVTITPRGNTLTIASAGVDGTRTGGIYSVSGTIGQQDANGPITGGSFIIDGGFWRIIAAVQTPGGPLLTIARTTTNTAAIYWPSPSTDFTLQENTNSIAMVNWSNILSTPTDNGTTKTGIVNPPTGSRFFRLRSV